MYAINQVWQGDMAHYLYGYSKLYTIYITDVYSQEIIGYGAYASNEANKYVEVMRKAVNRAKSKGIKLNGMIHHSDGGKQYESDIYENLCNRHGILQSMCMYSFENPYAEKTSDLINNGYLNYWKPMTLEELRACQQKAVIDHSSKRKKTILNGLSPIEFKTKLKGVPTIPHTLMLKPRNPEQPRKRIVKQSLNLTFQKTRM